MKLKPETKINTINFEPNVDRATELRRMKWIATALLGLATLIFIVASIYEEQYLWVGFVRAAAEAAMVGAVADWFAVTALFRHPLGLKIPHTAILPRRKDSFGRSFGEFVQNNFLSEPVITARLRSMNMALLAARWLNQPANSQAMTDFGALALRGMVQVVKDEDVQDLIEHGLVNWIRTIEITPIVGGVLAVVSSGNRQKELVVGGVKLIGLVLEENKPAIRERIALETPWWVPQTVEDAIYQRVIVLLEETLGEIETNPDHPIYQRFEALIQKLVEDLQNSPDMIAQGEAMKEEFLQDPAFQQFSISLWLDIKNSLLERSPEERSTLQQTAQQGVMKLARALQEDEALQAKINRWIETAAHYLIAAYGHEVGHLISNTISEWDAEAASYKIELQVGKDLQFIRINGTLVGGLVGLVIHSLSLLLL